MRRARPPSAPCGRSSSPSRRRRSRARSRRAHRDRVGVRRRGRSCSTATSSSTSAPSGVERTVQPGGTTTVVSYSSTSSGPLRLGATRRARRRVPRSCRSGGPKSARRVPPRRAARRRARTAHARGRARSAAAPDRRPASPPRAASRRSARGPLRSARRVPPIPPVELTGQLDGDAPALAAVAHVGDAVPLDARRRGAIARASPPPPAQLVEVPLAALTLQSGRGGARPGEQQAGGGEEPGERRHDRGLHAGSAASAAAWMGPEPP